MNTKIYPIVLATLGAPHGYRQRCILGSTSEAEGIKQLDLDPRAIVIPPGAELYALHKHPIEGAGALIYTKYIPVQEMASSRTGSFVGVALASFREAPGAMEALPVLDSFADLLIEANVQEGKLRTNDISHIIIQREPQGFSALSASTKPIEYVDYEHQSGRSILIVVSSTEPDALAPIVDRAIALLSEWTAVYLTSSTELARYVHSKGLIEIIDAKHLEAYVEDALTSWEKRVDHNIEELLAERSRRRSEREHKLTELSAEIERMERLHRENDQQLSLVHERRKALIEAYDMLDKTLEDYRLELHRTKDYAHIGRTLDDVLASFARYVNEQKRIPNIEALRAPYVNVEGVRKTAPSVTPKGKRTSGNLRREHKSRGSEGIDGSIVMYAVIFFFGLLVGVVGIYLFLDVSTPELLTDPLEDSVYVERTLPIDTLRSADSLATDTPARL